MTKGMRARDILIYLVDDDESIRRALRVLLKSDGYRVETLNSVEEFLRSAPLKGKSILILDVLMPEMNGPALQRHLQESNWNPPVIFITAYEDPALKDQAFKQGAVAWLKKPFDEKELFAAIRVSYKRLNEKSR